MLSKSAPHARTDSDFDELKRTIGSRPAGERSLLCNLALLMNFEVQCVLQGRADFSAMPLT